MPSTVSFFLCPLAMEGLSQPFGVQGCTWSTLDKDRAFGHHQLQACHSLPEQHPLMVVWMEIETELHRKLKVKH
jgi:hypothetical protein